MINRKSLAVTLIALLVSLLFNSLSLAQDSLLVSYQGRLTDDSDNPVTGVKSMTFTIYDGAGVSKWTESHSAVQVNDGLFNVILGSQTALPDSVFTGDDRYLGIAVGSDPEMSPRTLLTSVPSAAVAKNSASGSVFTRWGNSTAPTGTTLLYSGFAYGTRSGWISHTDPVVLQTNDTAAAMSEDGADLVPVSVARTPPGITSGSQLRAGVCFTDKPVFTLWGSHIPPAGWSVLYRGYVMGHVNDAGSATTLLCVECENFETYTYPEWQSSVFGVTVDGVVGGHAEQFPPGTYVKCAVCAKD
jgi:hypothetical protein